MPSLQHTGTERRLKLAARMNGHWREMATKKDFPYLDLIFLQMFLLDSLLNKLVHTPVNDKCQDQLKITELIGTNS